MRAIILAAGLSSRLGNLTKDRPKSCLNLYEEQSLLGLSLSKIRDAGFNDLVIATGHKESKIIDLVENQSSIKFNSITYKYNPHYAQRNNIYSCFLIRDFIDESSFIFNSDIFYDYRILKRAVEASYNDFKDKSFMVIDDKKKLTNESMKVTLYKNSYLGRVNKGLSNKKSFGEYIGMLRLIASDIDRFKSTLTEMVQREEFDKYYEDVIDQILIKNPENLKIYPFSTQGLDWTEVDDSNDLNRAKELIKKHTVLV